MDGWRNNFLLCSYLSLLYLLRKHLLSVLRFVFCFLFFCFFEISASRRTVAVDYLAGDVMKPTSVADLMETYDYDQYHNNNPSTSHSHVTTASSAEMDENVVIRQHQVGQHHHQQTDIPLQLSDILPADRRSYDKMEPPKREGIS